MGGACRCRGLTTASRVGSPSLIWVLGIELKLLGLITLLSHFPGRTCCVVWSRIFNCSVPQFPQHEPEQYRWLFRVCMLVRIKNELEHYLSCRPSGLTKSCSVQSVLSCVPWNSGCELAGFSSLADTLPLLLTTKGLVWGYKGDLVRSDGLHLQSPLHYAGPICLVN